MLDLRFIRENVGAVEENCRNRGVEADVGLVVELADRRSALIQESNELRKRQNEMAKSIGKERDEEARGRLIAESRAMKERLPAREEELREVEERLRDEQLKIPNMTHPDSPIGKDDTENVEILTFPLIFGAWITAIVFSLLNAALLLVRIRTENRALQELAG